jgi:murein DD-endopeptidase MepM/ murein hydrolase activator NlpD
VYTTYEDEGLGTTVVIRHENGYVTMYSSLDAEVTVSAGDTVELGQHIGYVGSSALLETAIGDHVHFCVTQNDASVNPADFFALS